VLLRLGAAGWRRHGTAVVGYLVAGLFQRLLKAYHLAGADAFLELRRKFFSPGEGGERGGEVALFMARQPEPEIGVEQRGAVQRALRLPIGQILPQLLAGGELVGRTGKVLLRQQQIAEFIVRGGQIARPIRIGRILADQRLQNVESGGNFRARS